MAKTNHKLVVGTALTMPFVIGLGFAQDPVKVAPKHWKVLMENHRVRVLELRLKPGEKVPMHSHPGHVTYTLSSFKGKYVSPDGGTVLGAAKANQAAWTDPITHASENVGDTEIHALVVEMKDQAKKKAKKR